MTAKELMDEANRLFPHTAVMISVQMWNWPNAKPVFQLWVSALSRNIEGESLEEIHAQLVAAAPESPIKAFDEAVKELLPSYV